MKKKNLLYLTVVLLVFFSISVVKFTSKKQLLQESFQVQLLENLFKPLDLSYFYLAFAPNTLPKYEITATRTDLIKLYETLPKTKDENEINQKRIVENREYIPVKIKIDGTEYAARMSVKGHDYRNYLGEKKSLRVRLNNNHEAPINAINFIVPEERAFVDDQTNYLFSQKLGFFSLKPGFAWVSLNGANLGVFQTLEDQEDEQVLESHGLSPEDIFYGPEYKQQVISGGPWPNLLESIEYWKLNNQGNGNPSPFSPLERLIEINKLNGVEFYSKIQEVLDIDQYLKFAAANYVMGDPHQDNVHNMFLLFRKEKGLIWFVPNNNSVAPIKNLQGYHFNDFTEKILSNPQFYWKRNEIIWQLINDYAFRDELLDNVNNTYNMLKAPIYQDSLKPFRFLAFKADMSKRKNILHQNFLQLENYFSDYRINTSTIRDGNTVVVKIESNSFFRPYIKSIEYPGEVTAYIDVDKNRIFNRGDVLISPAQDIPLTAAEFIQNPIDEIRPTAISQVIIVGNSNNILLDKIKVNLFNPLTGKDLESSNKIVN